MQDVFLKLHPHQALEAKAIGRGSRWSTVVAVGGVGSGKTLLVAWWMLDRSRFDTSQFHGLFGTTGPQLQQAVLAEALQWLEAAGVETIWNRCPPPEWRDRWKRAGIKTPTRLKKYTNVLVLSTGLHVYCGSMSNRSYRQVKGMKFGSVLIEEVCHGASEEGVRFVFERVRCGLRPEQCASEHAHVKILHGNPPDDDGHWIYSWLAKWEAAAAAKAGRSESPALDTYPCLIKGLGDVLYIPSRTIDNLEFLGSDYLEGVRSTVDEETAKRVLDGVLTRTKKGRVYNGYDPQQNDREIDYDPSRGLYVALDFNVNPAVGLIAHPLRPGEYATEHYREGVTAVGVIGELFHVGGLDVSGLCAALLHGDRGNQGHMPTNWRGLLEHHERVTFFGDATSTYQRMAGNEWQAVDDIIGKALRGRYSRKVPEKNPFVALGVRAVNAKFCSSNGVRSLYVHPRCTELIADLLTVTWDKTGKDVQKYGYRPDSSSKLWQRGHLSDALRYMVSALFPMGYEHHPAGSLPVIPRSTIRAPRVR